MKSYTDIEQSKVLSKILPLESADMFLAMNGTIPVMSKYVDDGYVTADDTAIPCWSLAALLGILPDDCGIDKEDGKYVASYLVSNECGSYTNDNPIDACYELILKLNELNLL